jgi:hypothetical protein
MYIRNGEAEPRTSNWAFAFASNFTDIRGRPADWRLELTQSVALLAPAAPFRLPTSNVGETP